MEKSAHKIGELCLRCMKLFAGNTTIHEVLLIQNSLSNFLKSGHGMKQVGPGKGTLQSQQTMPT